MNKACKISFDAKCFKEIASECLDLLKAMLEKDPKNRLSSGESLKHKLFGNKSKNNLNIENKKLNDY